VGKVSELPFTGERFIPGLKGEIWMEHWHRYHFAARWAAGKRVLDVACGEGYGSALLARGAAHVTGVDVSAQAIAHAKAAYADRGNLEFLCASCTRLPLPDASVDVAITFETIEHIAEQERFLDELARVLKPDGVLVLSCPNKLEYSDKRNYQNEFHVKEMSCPNKLEYSDKRNYQNEFHVKEMYRDELERMVAARFPDSRWYGQRPTFFSVIAPEPPPRPAPKGEGELFETDEFTPSEFKPNLAAPLYFLVAASRSRAALESVPAALSVLSDRDDWMYQDYGKVIRELRASVERGVAMERQLAEKNHELLQRRGWRWWLKLPFIRLGLLK
jgi:ubiquinone/menaquinone biosynthesis C-methylase UbiE